MLLVTLTAEIGVPLDFTSEGEGATSEWLPTLAPRTPPE